MKRKLKTDDRRKIGVTTMQKIENIKDTCALYAPNIERNYYDDFVEDILLPTEKSTFEKHLKNCAICKREVAESKRLQKIVSQSPRLTEFGLKRSAAIRMRYMDQILSRIVVPDEYIALAASPPRRVDVHGVAYGVAVNKETNQGILLKCTAAVSDKILDQSPLEVRARELKSFARDGMEYKISVPTTLLENLLKDMFVTHPLLLPLKLYDKTIRVHVDFAEDGAIESGAHAKLNGANCYICEADSLELAVLIAILSAVKRKKVDNNSVFSSGVSLNGCLEPVGDLKQKIACAQRQGVKFFIMAEASCAYPEKQDIKESRMNLHFFEKLDDVLAHIGLIQQKSMKQSIKLGKRGLRRKDK